MATQKKKWLIQMNLKNRLPLLTGGIQCVGFHTKLGFCSHLCDELDFYTYISKILVLRWKTLMFLHSG